MRHEALKLRNPLDFGSAMCEHNKNAQHGVGIVTKKCSIPTPRSPFPVSCFMWLLAFTWQGSDGRGLGFDLGE